MTRRAVWLEMAGAGFKPTLQPRKINLQLQDSFPLLKSEHGQKLPNIIYGQLCEILHLCPQGDYSTHHRTLVQDAVTYFLKQLYLNSKPLSPVEVTHPQAKPERNRLLRARYKAGESAPDLARAFGISIQRIHQILKGRHR